MTYLQSLISTICFLGVVTSGFSQSSDSPSDYYYNFTAEIENFTSSDEALIRSDISEHQFMKVEDTCEISGKVLISVSVKYEKRVKDIESEIETILTTSISDNRVKKLRKVNIQEKSAFCQ